MKKALLITGAALAVLVVVIVVGVSLWLDPNQFKPRLESEMSRALGRQVTIGSIRIAWLSMGVAVDDVAIADDAAFSSTPFVSAKSVVVGVNLKPLIMSRSLQIESFRLESPRLTLLRGTSGAWNFSKLASASGTGGSSGAAGAMGVLVQKITIADGQLVVGGPALRGKERVYNGLSLDVSNLSLTTRFPFRLTASTPGGGNLRLEGEAGPVSLVDVSTTPFDATAEIKHLDLASTGLTDPTTGLAGFVDFAGALRSTGARVGGKGKLVATKIQLVAGGAPSGVPIELDYESDYEPKALAGVLKQGDVHIGKAIAHLTGSYDVAGGSPSVRMKLVGQALAASELQAALPAVGVTLPSGASLKEGTLNTEMTITGPLDRLVITGPVVLSNATLAGYDLSGKLGALGAFAGLPKSTDTRIEQLSSVVRVAQEGTRVDALVLNVPVIGTLAGHGTVAPQGALDFSMLATLVRGGTLAGGLARVASVGQSNEALPFRIEGTANNPLFVPDVKAIANDVVKGSATKAAGLLGGSKASGALGALLGGKK